MLTVGEIGGQNITKKIDSMPLYLRLLIIGIFVATSALFNYSSVGEALNLKGLDLFQKKSGPASNIAIIAIDSASIQELGQWPWPRSTHAQIIELLDFAGVKAIAYDVAFFESDAKSDLALINSLSQVRVPVVLVSEAIYVKGQNYPNKIIEPYAELKYNPRIKTGIANVPVKADGIARFLPTSVTFNQQNYPPLSQIVANLVSDKFEPNQNALVGFAGASGTFPTYSFKDVLSGQIDKKEFAEKIVLIGATASNLHDTVLVPLKNPVMNGVEWQANAINNILNESYIVLLNQNWGYIITVILGLIALIRYKNESSKIIGLYLFFANVSVFIASYLLYNMGIGLAFATPIIILILMLGMHSFYQWRLEEKEKHRLRESITPYFSPQIMRLVLDHPEKLKLGGELREVTVLFSDIRNFTTISEGLAPEKLTHLLQEYFTIMSEEILSRDGVLEKFIGDAIVAFWGAPFEQKDKANRAVKTALAMISKLKVLQQKWLSEGYPYIDIGVGINTGVATVGHTGSAKRFDYAAIGDTTNTASRIEGLNKEFETHIIISDSTKQQLTLDVKTHLIGKVIVKGKSKLLKLYQVVLDGEKLAKKVDNFKQTQK